MSKASKRRRRRARAARVGHGRGKGKTWVRLTGPGVNTTDALLGLFGFRRIGGEPGDVGGEFVGPPGILRP